MSNLKHALYCFTFKKHLDFLYLKSKWNNLISFSQLNKVNWVHKRDFTTQKVDEILCIGNLRNEKYQNDPQHLQGLS